MPTAVEIKMFGETHTASWWCQEFGVSPKRYFEGKRLGMKPKEIFEKYGNKETLKRYKKEKKKNLEFIRVDSRGGYYDYAFREEG